MNIRILSDKDVERSLTMKEAIETNKLAFQKLYKKECTIPERHAISLKNGCTLFKPGYIAGMGLGLKLVSVRPENAKIAKPTVPAVVMLVDEVTGLPACVMNATYLTALRTAAGSGVATDILAKHDSNVLCVFGAGLQAKLHIEAMLSVRPTLRKIFIINRTIKRALDLAQFTTDTYSEGFEGLEVSAIEMKDEKATEEAVKLADIVVLATNSSTPVLRGSWLTPETHINGIGSYTPDMQEIDKSALALSEVIIDSKHALSVGDLKSYHGNKQDILTLGKLILEPSARQGENLSNTFFKSVGTAVQDIMTAAAILKNANQQGLGTCAPI